MALEQQKEVAAAKGLKVGLAEGWDLGGTCVNRGCVPKKTIFLFLTHFLMNTNL